MNTNTPKTAEMPSLQDPTSSQQGRHMMGGMMPNRVWLRSPQGLITIGVLAIAVIGLVAVQGVHLLVLLPFAVFLLCPLMMFFMMRGMNRNNGQGGHSH